MSRFLSFILLIILGAIAQANAYVALSLTNLPSQLYAGLEYSNVTLNVSNVNSFSLPLDNVFDTVYPAGFTSSQNNCTNKTLTPKGTDSDTCTIVGDFKPVNSGTNSWSLKVAAYGRNFLQLYQVSHEVNVASPIITTSWTSKLPASSVVGEPLKVIELTISNEGDKDATFGSPAITWSETDSADFANESTNCKTTLAPQKNCYYRFQYQALTAGDKSIGGVLFYDAGKTINLPITTSTASKATITSNWTENLPSTSTLGLAAANCCEVTFHNTSDVTAYNFVPKIQEVNIGDFNSQINNCGSSLAGSASCTYQFNLTPMTTGTKYATAAATFADGSVADDKSAESIATGSLGLTAIWSPNMPEGGIVDITNQKISVTYTNTGETTINSFTPTIDLTGSADFDFISKEPDTCPNLGASASLSVGAQCVYSYDFEPKSIGSKYAIANASYDGFDFSVKSRTSAVILEDNPIIFTIAATPPNETTGWVTHLDSSTSKSAPVDLVFKFYNPSPTKTFKYAIATPSDFTALSGLGKDDCTVGVTTLTEIAPLESCYVRLSYSATSAGVVSELITEATFGFSLPIERTIKVTTLDNNIVKNKYNRDSTFPLFSDIDAKIVDIHKIGTHVYLGTTDAGIGVGSVNSDTGEVAASWSRFSFPAPSINHLLINGSHLYATTSGTATDQHGLLYAALTAGIPPAVADWSKYQAGFQNWASARSATEENYIVTGELKAPKLHVANLASDKPSDDNVATYNLDVGNLPSTSGVSDILLRDGMIYVATHGAGLHVTSISNKGIINVSTWRQYYGGATSTSGWPNSATANQINSILLIKNHIYVGTNDGLGVAALDNNGFPESQWTFYQTTATSAAPIALDSNSIYQLKTDSAEHYLYIGTASSLLAAVINDDGLLEALITYDQHGSNLTTGKTLTIFGDGMSNSGFYISPYSVGDETAQSSNYLAQGTLP